MLVDEKNFNPLTHPHIYYSTAKCISELETDQQHRSFLPWLTFILPAWVILSRCVDYVYSDKKRSGSTKVKELIFFTEMPKSCN
jgi:hypothetical protein